MISPMSFLLNLKRKGNDRITMKMQVVMWNAGLRGAVAYALSLRLPESMPGRALFVTTIHAVVIFTILVHGSLTGPLLRLTSLSTTDQSSGTDYSHLNDSSLAPLATPKKKKIHGFWSTIDKKYLIPFLSYPRDVYRQEQEEKERNITSELQDTSLLDENDMNGHDYATNGHSNALQDDLDEQGDAELAQPPVRSEEHEEL
jgi:hypothetical protein